MFDGYDIEWEFPYTDGYTGPYYSDGKIQASVANGKYKPRSKLAAISRDHDTSFNLCPDYDCRSRADQLYLTRTADMSFIPRSIGKLPSLMNSLKLRGSTNGGGRRKIMGNITDTYAKGAGQFREIVSNTKPSNLRRVSIAKPQIDSRPPEGDYVDTEQYKADGTCTLDETQPVYIPKAENLTSQQSNFGLTFMNDDVWDYHRTAGRKRRRKKKKKNQIEPLFYM